MVVYNVFKMEKIVKDKYRVIGFYDTYENKTDAEIRKVEEEEKEKQWNEEFNERISKVRPEILEDFKKNQEEKYIIEVKKCEVL